MLRDDVSTPRMTFTQQDINDERVLYVHSGILENDGFFVSVGDGRFEEFYMTFNIRVLPLELSVRKVAPLVLVQGQVAISIDTDLLDVVTNGDVNDVMFNVTDPPKHGSIFVGDAFVFGFT